MWIDAAAVGSGRPSRFGDDDRLAGIVPDHGVVVLLRVLQRVVNGSVLPGRISVHGDEVEHLGQRLQLVGPGHVVLAEGDRLQYPAPDLLDVRDQAVDGHHVVGPLHAGLVADGYREHHVPVAGREVDEPADLRRIGPTIGRQRLVAEVRAPGAVRIAHLRSHVESEHDLEVQRLAPDHVEDRLGVRAAVVEPQVSPVSGEDQQVLADLVAGGIHPGDRTLVLPVAGVADGVAGPQTLELASATLDDQRIKHTSACRPCPTGPNRRRRRPPQPPSRPRRRPRSRTPRRRPPLPTGKC